MKEASVRRADSQLTAAAIRQRMETMSVEQIQTLFSLVTWSREPLSSADCQVVMRQFKSLTELLSAPSSAVIDALVAMPISELAKESIGKFVAGGDFYLD